MRFPMFWLQNYIDNTAEIFLNSNPKLHLLISVRIFLEAYMVNMA